MFPQKITSSGDVISWFIWLANSVQTKSVRTSHCQVWANQWANQPMEPLSPHPHRIIWKSPWFHGKTWWDHQFWWWNPHVSPNFNLKTIVTTMFQRIFHRIFMCLLHFSSEFRSFFLFSMEFPRVFHRHPQPVPGSPGPSPLQAPAAHLRRQHRVAGVHLAVHRGPRLGRHALVELLQGLGTTWRIYHEWMYV